MTTSDLAPGRPAAAPALSRIAFRLIGCLVLCAAALPAFAQQGAALAEGTMISASNLFASTLPASALSSNNLSATSFSAPAISIEMALPNRSTMFVGDFNRPAVATPAAHPVAAGRVQNLLQHALALLGTPYRWGGTGTDGFDCSGLVGYLFRSTLGIELPRVSRDMATSGTLISDRANLSPGDLVFFGHKGRVSHVGIYVGEGRFVHAPRTGRDVTVSSLEGGYWGDKYMEARRVAGI